MARPSQAAATEAARAAEFNEKKWVWVPDEKEGYVAGWVHKEEANEGEIILAAGGEVDISEVKCPSLPGLTCFQMRRVPLGSLSKMNPPKFDRVDDMADLTYLNEASVVHNLRLRYEPGDIYVSNTFFIHILARKAGQRLIQDCFLSLSIRTPDYLFILTRLSNNIEAKGGVTTPLIYLQLPSGPG
jgi:hypothetical protein